ncbi:MAG: hypothetical protein ACYTFT_07895 [Planctomycetota bacterium]|jgi:hypothetical protein
MATSTPAAASLALGLALLAPLGLLPACAQNETQGTPAASESVREAARAPEAFSPKPVIAVREVYLDGVLKGYMKVKEDERVTEGFRLFLVYDINFVHKGFMTNTGRTHKVRDHKLVDIGFKSREDSLRILLGGTRDSEVALVPMPEPLTLTD